MIRKRYRTLQGHTANVIYVEEVPGRGEVFDIEFEADGEVYDYVEGQTEEQVDAMALRQEWESIEAP